jgi:hypothetical protein
MLLFEISFFNYDNVALFCFVSSCRFDGLAVVTETTVDAQLVSFLTRAQGFGEGSTLTASFKTRHASCKQYRLSIISSWIGYAIYFCDDSVTC